MSFLDHFYRKNIRKRYTSLSPRSGAKCRIFDSPRLRGQHGTAPLVSRVEVLETHRGTAVRIGCQARRAPQTCPHCRKSWGARRAWFQVSFSPFLTTFSVSYANSSGFEVCARTGAWRFLARGQDCDAFLLRATQERGWKIWPASRAIRRLPLFFKTSCILHLFIIYLRYNITCMPICIYCLSILVFILKQAVTW